ncbi:MAG: hypothetical protein QY309_13205 [Cyclobacteriaceae bacterium]|nr:MAG: hypothetical protein QY309_13055 [Cyclobacteriaceae bacterium]WKZ58824.1 MAG: hypothetical protein QY309_13205 [Cyclobacteriaceae bacterium]
MTTSSFEEIDKSLDNWLKKYGLIVYKEYKDEEVRHIPIIDNQGTKYELAIVPLGNSSFKLHLFWSDDNDKRILRLKNKKTWEKEVNKKDMEDSLNEAYEIVESWITDIGHERKWY